MNAGLAKECAEIHDRDTPLNRDAGLITPRDLETSPPTTPQLSTTTCMPMSVIVPAGDRRALSSREFNPNHSGEGFHGSHLTNTISICNV